MEETGCVLLYGFVLQPPPHRVLRPLVLALCLPEVSPAEVVERRTACFQLKDLLSVGGELGGVGGFDEDGEGGGGFHLTQEHLPPVGEA